MYFKDICACAASYYDYDINYRKPGLVVIFNNKKFDNNLLLERSGSEKDVGRLRQVFENLNFKIKTHCDLPENEMRDWITEYANRDYSDDSCFICFIMSHGKDDKILSSDNQFICISDFIDPFVKNKSLNQKPKLFFIQACRKKNKFPSVNYRQKTPIRIPIGDDFLFCNSTVEGFYSLRHTKKGSIYIQTLCDVISENAQLEICQILIRVNIHLTQNWQMRATFQSHLSRYFYLTKQNQSINQ